MRVIRANPDVMLTMKVAAFRTSDHPDIAWLAEHLGLADPDEIIELTERVLRVPLNETSVCGCAPCFRVSSLSSLHRNVSSATNSRFHAIHRIVTAITTTTAMISTPTNMRKPTATRCWACRSCC